MSNQSSPKASSIGNESPTTLETVTPAMDPSMNPNSPFYLHLRENPGSILVSPLLNGTNYYYWSKTMWCALTSKNKI